MGRLRDLWYGWRHILFPKKYAIAVDIVSGFATIVYVRKNGHGIYHVDRMHSTLDMRKEVEK